MKKAKIVLIEDDEILSKIICEELTDVGFIVKRAFDGKEGSRLVESEKPDLVLLDIILPQKNGFEVLEYIKKSPKLHHTPVVLLTMLGSNSDIEHGFSLGASSYIVKGQHTVSEIVEKVENFFGKIPKADTGQGSNKRLQ